MEKFQMWQGAQPKIMGFLKKNERGYLSKAQLVKHFWNEIRPGGVDQSLTTSLGPNYIKGLS